VFKNPGEENRSIFVVENGHLLSHTNKDKVPLNSRSRYHHSPIRICKILGPPFSIEPLMDPAYQNHKSKMLQNHKHSQNPSTPLQRLQSKNPHPAVLITHQVHPRLQLPHLRPRPSFPTQFTRPSPKHGSSGRHGRISNQSYNQPLC